MVFVNELLKEWPSYDQMTSFAEDVHRQVQEHFEQEFTLVAKGHTTPDLIRFERVDRADGKSFEIHLTMYPASFNFQIEEVYDGL